MTDLVEQAKKIIDERYMPPYHTTAAIIVAKNGRQYSGINTDHFTGYLCAETAALAGALNDGETNFDQIIAVGKNNQGEFDIINPCGKCRQLLHDFAPDINVAILDNGEHKIVSINELLPYGFKRRQGKIQRARQGEIVE